MEDKFYRSAELRWFLAGQRLSHELDSDPIVEWFRGTLEVKKEGPRGSKVETRPFVKFEKPRTDQYLLLPDTDTASFKQRQGKLEVKALVAGPRPFSMGAITGHLDQWVKWSFSPTEAKLENPAVTMQEQLEGELNQAGPWQAVTKVRFLQKYSFDTGQPVAVSPDLMPTTGCQIELTMVSVQATVANWLTFGFEAFGPSGRVTAMLDEAVQEFFKVHGQAPFPLDGRDSLSYPAWLALLR